MALVPGDLLQGRYRVGQALGQGGMGSVFEARDQAGGPALAVKQLRVDAPELLAAFRDECAFLARVSSPHLLRVLDFGSERLRGELHHYYVAERIQGVTLAEHARRVGGAGALPALADALVGLSILHDAGVRHGDFTPSNVLVDGSGHGVLIDLGCARPFGITLQLAGTQGYLAPELLAGQAGDARADLFGVGRTLHELFAREREVPDVARRLTSRLLRERPDERPVDVAEVLEVLGRRPNPRRAAHAPARLLGRSGQVEEFDAWLAAFANGDEGARVFAVWGEAGMGSSRLLRELSWRAQVQVRVLRGRGPRPVSGLLATALDLAEPVSTRRGVLAAAGVLAEREEPLLLVLEDVERLEEHEQELLYTLGRAPLSRGRLSVLASSRRPLPLAQQRVVECGPLSAPAMQEWLGSFVSDKRAQELMRRSGGAPRRIERLLAEWLETGNPVRSALDAADPSVLHGLAPSERESLALWFVQSDESGREVLGLTTEELAPLLERGLLEREGDALRLEEGARNAILGGALTASELQGAHRLAAGWWSLRTDLATGLVTANVVRHLALGGEDQRAEALFLERAGELGQGPREIAKSLQPLFERSERAGVQLELSRVLLELGRPRRALRAAARAVRLGQGTALRRRAALHAADALARLGRPARAARLLGQLLARDAAFGQGPEGAEVLQRLARARLAQGDYVGARASAELSLAEGPPAAIAALSHEIVGVAHAYLGESARAEEELNRAVQLLAEQTRPRDLSRIQSHRAMLAFRAGRIEAALADYAGALALAEEHELDDLIATGLLNLGTAEQQAGRWGEALHHYQRGAAFARAMGRTSTELTLEFNSANLYAEIGAFERAEEALARLGLKAQVEKMSHFQPGIALVRAEIRLARAEPEPAEQELLAAERYYAGRAQPRELFELCLRRVDVELLRGRPREAERRLLALAQDEVGEAFDMQLAFVQAQARVDLGLGREVALERLEAARLRAQREGLLALEAQLEAQLGDVALRSGRADQARARHERSRRLWDRIADGLPAPLVALFWRHERRARLVEPSRPIAVAPGGAPHGAEAYRRLLALNRRLNSSLSLDRVLEYAVQAALDLTEAERAFLLLVPDAAAASGRGLPEVAVARSTDPSLPAGEGPSQGIVRRTLEREEPVLTTDAQGDPRFVGQGSIHALRLKSVLSVPVTSPSGVLGVLYVDCRVQRGRFTDAERELLLAFADQLALAIGNARLHRELERKTAELAQQKHAVEQLSRGQAREIARLSRTVETQRQTLELRYDYSQIVGRGPAMRAVLERVERLIDSEASVLLLGESGTGKELFARAIHFNGPRKKGPFLALNCAALPESLLESELFGHVRGAFTGADRDKQGLLVAAAGGTLFLDELGELPASTQAKLLRVLQEREVRPLGSEKAVRVDVRLLSATHRDLESAMAQGKFREDLYYRVAVVTVRLPPLRERPEDLPAVAEKILQELARDAGRPVPELGQDALRRLSAHAFPGNVRELQNVLTRAFVLLPNGAKIRAQDLDLGERRAPAPRARSRHDFERDEKDRILAALRSARWNVSVVSRTLGIPRNTLYRKLARYGLERAT